MARLFPDPDVTSDAASSVVSVAVAANVYKPFDYLWPDRLGQAQPGVRVRVPFGRGNRKTLGVVVETDRLRGEHKLKAVAEVVDDKPRLTPALEELAQWITRYYLSPPGMVYSAMIPSVVGRRPPKTETVVYLDSEPEDWPKSLGLRQREVLDELFEARRQGVEPLPAEQLTHHSGSSRDTLRRLIQRELIRTETRERAPESLSEATGECPFELNDDQKTVLADVVSTLGKGFSVTLLHGVTGSGKTEIYLRAVQAVAEAGKQAILLVPEIALATQTLTRLAERLPRVVVLHSGLTAGQRATAYEQIRDGRAATVIGPRSAVFAPAERLGLIVVDEEHEGSYKQDTAPRYHGRDVAIKRASIEGVPVLLGSATPSLESLSNAGRGRYRMLKLPERILGLPMPKLEMVHLRNEVSHERIELIGKTLEGRMASVLDRDEQIILLMNRRGYANYVFCPSCRWQLECRDCSRAMVFHQALGLAMCHYCESTTGVPRTCPACSKKLILFGLGIQRIENELARKFPAAVVARMDSDTMTSPKQFHAVFESFAAGKTDILLGTQMVAKGLDFPRVTLVGVVSADTALAIPDFRSAERTFQLIVQVAGRAGRGESGGEVVVQTLHPTDPAIQFAVADDYEGFAAAELQMRTDARVPPACRLVRFVVRHTNANRAQDSAGKLRKVLGMSFEGDPSVRIVGPSRCGVFKIRKHFRFEINVYTARPNRVQDALAATMGDLAHTLGAEVVVDVDPISLM